MALLEMQESTKRKRGRPSKLKTMTPETATTTDANTQVEAPKTVKLVAKKKVFDLDKFEKVTKEASYEKPAPLTSMDQVLNLDEKLVLSVMNLGLVRQAWKDARNSIAGVSPKIINQFVNVWRMIPPYSGMTETDEKGDVTKDSRKKQTQAIYAWIKSQPAILDSLKQAAAASSESDDEEETEDEE